MNGIELLNNVGVEYIGKKDVTKQEEKTFIVLGVARGGTSLISGSLEKLGIYTGDLSRSPVYEDVKLAMALEKNEIKQAKNIIEEYNKRYKIWSFKRPSSIDYISFLHQNCRNPIFLIIFKDLFSVSNRNKISMKTDLINGLEKAKDDYSKIISFIKKNNPNAFLLSYEKVMFNKEIFVDLLSDIIGKKNITQKQQRATLDFIKHNPKEYLNASRITLGMGRIGLVEENRVSGWAKYVSSDETALVELYINDILIQTTEAKDFRQHTLDNNIHSTGYCGYLFKLENKIQKGDKVSVKLSEEVNFLNNSNQIFQP